MPHDCLGCGALVSSRTEYCHKCRSAISIHTSTELTYHGELEAKWWWDCASLEVQLDDIDILKRYQLGLPVDPLKVPRGARQWQRKPWQPV